MKTAAEEAVMNSRYDFYEVQGMRVFPVYGVSSGVANQLCAFLAKPAENPHALLEEATLGRGGSLAQVRTANLYCVEFNVSDTRAVADARIELGARILEAL